MTVVCRVQNCYYYDRGFCSNAVTAINESGGCDLLYKKDGKPRSVDVRSSEGKSHPVKIIIEDCNK